MLVRLFRATYSNLELCLEPPPTGRVRERLRQARALAKYTSTTPSSLTRLHPPHTRKFHDNQTHSLRVKGTLKEEVLLTKLRSNPSTADFFAWVALASCTGVIFIGDNARCVCDVTPRRVSQPAHS